MAAAPQSEKGGFCRYRTQNYQTNSNIWRGDVSVGAREVIRNPESLDLKPKNRPARPPRKLRARMQKEQREKALCATEGICAPKRGRIIHFRRLH